MNSETVKCPFCAEEIKAEAILCKHCGSKLSQLSTVTSVPTSQVPNPDVTVAGNSQVGMSVSSLVLGSITIFIALVNIGLVESGEYGYILDEEIGLMMFISLPALGLGVSSVVKKQRASTAALIVSILSLVMVFFAATYTY